MLEARLARLVPLSDESAYTPPFSSVGGIQVLCLAAPALDPPPPPPGTTGYHCHRMAPSASQWRAAVIPNASHCTWNVDSGYLPSQRPNWQQKGPLSAGVVS